MVNNLLLINFGGPRDSSEIENFLLDLFMDPYTFDLPVPEFLRKKLALFIAKRRAPKVASVYAALGFGGGSPLVSETFKQASALKKFLEKKSNSRWIVNVAMMCGSPNLRNLTKDELTPSRENILLPLFPQYSRSTVLSASKIIEGLTGENPSGSKYWINPFYNNSAYLTACKNLILDFFKGSLRGVFLNFQPNPPIADWENITLVFSAHGIPERLIRKGDTYVRELNENVVNLTNMLRKENFHGEVFLSFQSRVGPMKWTEPNTIELFKKLGSQGHTRIAVYPISFVSDHLETLEEIGIQLKEIAIQSGIHEYYRIPALGVYPDFINALGDIVSDVLKKDFS